MVHLPHLSSYIRQCIVENDYSKVLANSNFSLTVSSKTFPVKKGQLLLSSRPISLEIHEHTTQALSKIVMQPSRKSPSSTVSSSPCPSVSGSTVTSPSTQVPSSLSNGTRPSVPSDTEKRFIAIEQSLTASSSRMDSLEELCRHLKNKYRCHLPPTLATSIRLTGVSPGR